MKRFTLAKIKSANVRNLAQLYRMCHLLLLSACRKGSGAQAIPPYPALPAYPGVPNAIGSGWHMAFFTDSQYRLNSTSAAIAAKGIWTLKSRFEVKSPALIFFSNSGLEDPLKRAALGLIGSNSIEPVWFRPSVANNPANTDFPAANSTEEMLMLAHAALPDFQVSITGKPWKSAFALIFDENNQYLDLEANLPAIAGTAGLDELIVPQ